MKINVAKLPNELRDPALELMDRLDFTRDVNGYVLDAQSGTDELTVTFDGNKQITIGYPSLNQFFRGLRLIKQHFDKKGFKIAEKCAASELGIMLDCSRNAVRSVEHVKEIIRHLAIMGYNQLQLYTEDTYEVEGEPYFGYMRGRYTMAEMREIDDYAARFGIEVVPCIQTLAHLGQIFRWKAYGHINDVKDILLIDDERTYELIEHMFATTSKCFRSRNIHIGMDEAHLVGRGRYEDKFGAVANRTELLIKHLTRVVEIAAKYGYEKPMMWSDMFFRLAFDGDYYSEKGDIPDEVYASVPENVRLVYWDYYNANKAVVENMVRLHKNFRRDVIFGGGAWMWSGFAPSNRHSFVTTDVALDVCMSSGIDKVLITMWGDNGAECSALAVLPTLVMTAERLYGHAEFETAFRAVTDMDLKQFMQIEAVNDIGANEYALKVCNPSKYMLYSDCIGGLFDGTIREGDGEIYKQHVLNIKAAEKAAGRYAYIFATQRTLADVMTIKYELGIKTHNAYKSGDKAALKALVKSGYVPLLKKLDAFYDAFRAQWERENKPNGFEIQDYRIGGLRRHIERCADRLMRYADGKDANIPELEEPMLDPVGEATEATKATFNFNHFARTISTNIM